MIKTNRLNYRIKLWIAILALLVSFLPSSKILAKEGDSSITLSPAKTTLSLKAGEMVKGSYKIFNTGAIDFEFKAYAKPFSPKAGCGQDFETKSEQTQLADWVKFKNDTYRVKANQNVTVEYEVQVPKDIPDGGQYAVIFNETKAGSGASILSSQRVGMLIYATTNGKTILKGALGEVKIDAIKLDKILSVQLPITNSGNTDFTTESVMEIKNLFGKTVDVIEQKGLRVLPKSDCGVRLRWDRAPIFGLFKVKITSKFLDKEFKKESWVFFISPIVIGALVLLILIFALWRHYGKQKKHY